MRLAGKHIAVVEPSIRADPRFEHVELSSFTSDNGCLIVLGYVDSDQALNDLRRMIAASKPPVFTKWAVNVIPEETKPK